MLTWKQQLLNLYGPARLLQHLTNEIQPMNTANKKNREVTYILIQLKPYVPMRNTYTAEYDTDIKQEVSTYKPYRFHKCEK